MTPGLTLNPTLVIRDNVTTDEPDIDAKIYNLPKFKNGLATTLMTETYFNKEDTKPKNGSKINEPKYQYRKMHEQTFIPIP